MRVTRILNLHYLLSIIMVPLCHGFVPLQSQKALLGPAFDSSSEESESEPDLFDYFDPLRSPHDYPEGISPNTKPKENGKETERQAPKQPLGLDLFRSEFPSAFQEIQDSVEKATPKGKKFSSTNKGDGEEVDLLDVFDPTLSPHAYPNGIPSTKKKEQATVGILLMDHGSRNEASNQRLHDLARLYSNSLGDQGPSKAVIKAAHMEIASPSIPECLQSMVEAGVSEIICHPYFLSPGRHVKEDIPAIVQEAVESQGIDIPVTVTPPTGSNTDLMISAIHSLVEESSALLNQQQHPTGTTS